MNQKIADLTKERMKIRTTDPARSAAITMIIDGATKVAKNEKREVLDSDIEKAAKNLCNSAKGDIIALKDKGITDFSVYENEIKIYSEFLPPEVDPAVDEKIVADFIATLSEDMFVKSNRGKIMGLSKNVPNINKGLLASKLDALLK